MIDIILNGRLGNQLFMYAMARKLQIQYNKKDIYINTSLLEENNCQNSLLSYEINRNVKFYNKKLRTRNNSFHGSIFQHLNFMKYFKETGNMNFSEIVSYEDKMERGYKSRGMFICRDRYKEYKDISNKRCIIAYGYFQSPKYFDDIRELLVKELTPKNKILEKNREIHKDICTSNSVCVSVRLGDDFLTNDIYNVCTLDYYKSAIQYLKQELENPKFFIFSDKPELLKEKFKGLDIDMVFESGNDPDYEKLRIMSACKHFILSNSSFSWWCQYLSNYKEKRVVAPSRWYNGDVPCDIYMDSWYLIEP